MTENSDKEEENNKEYAEGYSRGRSGDFIRDSAEQVWHDDDIEHKGYEAGQQDREEHGWKSADDCGSGETKDEGGCFLTSACVRAKGLSDHCLELSVLRNFRDKILLPSSEGRSAVKAYYSFAPGIVRAVNERSDSLRLWEGVYSDIQSAVRLVQQGKFNDAFRVYKDMSLKLKGRYL